MKTFPLFGKTLSFTEKELKYTEILQKYTKLSEQYREKYEIAYQNFGGWQTFWEQGESVGNKYIAEAAEEVVKAYVAHGTYDYVADEALCGCKEYFEWKSLWLDIEDVLTKVCEQYTDVQNFRNLRKQNRSRVNTVGFGVKGAIGAAIANEAANAATGLMHDFINSLATSSDYSKIKKKMQQCYQNDEFKDQILDSFQNVIFALRKSEESLYDIHREDYLPKDRKRADALLGNLQYIELDKQLDVLIEILQLNPYCSEAYEQLVTQYGDPQAEVYTLLQAFPVYDEQGLIYHLIENVDITPADLAASDSTHRKILAEATEELEQTFAPSIMKDHADYQAKLQNIKSILTTVCNHTYPSFAEAEKARDARSKFTHQVGNLSQITYEQLVTLIDQLKECDLQFPKTVDDYCSAANKEELKRRTVHTVTFDTFEQAEEARRIRNSAKDMLSAAKNKSIAEMKNMVPKMQDLSKGFSDLLIQDIVDELNDFIKKSELKAANAENMKRFGSDIDFNDMSQENHRKLVNLRHYIEKNYDKAESKEIVDKLSDSIYRYNMMAEEERKTVENLQQKVQEVPAGSIVSIVFMTIIRAIVCFGIMAAAAIFAFNFIGAVIAFFALCYFLATTYEKFSAYSESRKAGAELRSRKSSSSH